MHPYLLNTLEAAPKVVKSLIAFIDKDKLDQPTHRDRFTPRQVLAHLADWEPIFLERMIAGFKTPGAHVQGMDEGVRAEEQRYDQWKIEDCLSMFEGRRAETTSWLKSLTRDDWQKKIVHSEKGEMTLEDNANMLLGHDLYHLEQLSDVVQKGDYYRSRFA